MYSEYEKFQAQAAKARRSGSMRSRCTTKAPMRALARLQRRNRKGPPIGTVCAQCTSGAPPPHRFGWTS